VAGAERSSAVSCKAHTYRCAPARVIGVAVLPVHEQIPGGIVGVAVDAVVRVVEGKLRGRPGARGNVLALGAGCSSGGQSASDLDASGSLLTALGRERGEGGIPDARG